MGKSGGSGAAAAENVKVLVRCRPLSEKEKGNGHKSCVDLDLTSHSVAVKSLCGEPDRFTFDAVINNTFTQKDVFTQFILPLVDSVIDGFNATVFAYGQSGSGKTHTMTGVMGDEALEGVIPRCFKYIFDSVKGQKESAPNKSFSMYVSFVELYNGKVRDLLAKQQVSLDVRESKDHTFFVQGAHVPQVKFPEEIINLMEEGTERRRTASTELNSDSSRSHSVFTLVMECTTTQEDGTATSVTSKLNLVDLAGSERQNKTGASGDTLKEGCNINLSLSALGTVIDCIVKSAPHIPFRSSPLTMLLKDSLGGNSKTVMFANINPSERNLSETISTLRFADRAKQIKNKPVVNMDTKDQKIAELTQMLNEFREKLKKYETEGTESLEKELEELRERVGELEVSLDNAVRGREADGVDFSNEKSRLMAELANTKAHEAELEEQLSQVRSDLQVAEASAADEKAQRAEAMQLCATYLSPPPAASAAGAAPAELSVDDLATLLKTRLKDGGALAGGSGDGGSAASEELAQLQTQLQSLTAENKSLKKSLKATEKEMSAKLQESKASVKRAEAKAKQLTRDLEKSRVEVSAAATASTAAPSGTSTSPGPDAAVLQAAVAEAQKQAASPEALRDMEAALKLVTQRHEELVAGVGKELALAKQRLAKPADNASDMIQQYSALLCDDVRQTDSRNKLISALCQLITSLKQAWRQSLAVPMALASGDLDAAKQAVAGMEVVDTQSAETQAQVVSRLAADIVKAYHQRNKLVELIAATYPEANPDVCLKAEVREVLDQNEDLLRRCEVLTTETSAMESQTKSQQRQLAIQAQLQSSDASAGGAGAAAMLESLRVDVDEMQAQRDAMEKARDQLYDELKTQRAESAATDQLVAELQGKLSENETRVAAAQAAEEEATRMETRLRERADQLTQMRALLDKQKGLIVKSNEKAEYLQGKLRAVKSDAAAQEERYHTLLEEKDASTQRIINERVAEYVAARQDEVEAKAHSTKKLKKKIKKLEEAVRQLEIQYDTKVCECEELRSRMGEQKVEQLRLLRQLEDNGVYPGYSASDTPIDVDDQRENYHSALERAKTERQKKKDLFSLGEVQSVRNGTDASNSSRSRRRSRGSCQTDEDIANDTYL